ncbi:hypothetical protein GZ22_18220 (plasmid) [Terribacillus saccharophilus]|uniref:DUF4177 domain-containing protein n=1 Tax=Terribacillus saccharophilus TaxID=361277 RepID=A0A075LQH5_9BACI|nr:hypothetical protein GZ22_18220 [Terribacillus goriensis]
MRKFEYDIMIFRKHLNNEEFMHQCINEHGAKGWELVNIVPHTETTAIGSFTRTYKIVMYFKREI